MVLFELGASSRGAPTLQEEPPGSRRRRNADDGSGGTTRQAGPVDLGARCEGSSHRGHSGQERGDAEPQRLASHEARGTVHIPPFPPGSRDLSVDCICRVLGGGGAVVGRWAQAVGAQLHRHMQVVVLPRASTQRHSWPKTSRARRPRWLKFLLTLGGGGLAPTALHPPSVRTPLPRRSRTERRVHPYLTCQRAKGLRAKRSHGRCVWACIGCTTHG